MSEVKVNKLTPRTNCGTVTLGDSGDTFTIPAGVTITNNGTQTGFGRAGSVNWQTGSIKTGNFTAADGEGYFINSSSEITASLPAGSAGAIVAFSDYARNFSTHNFRVSPNGSEKIGGVADDVLLDVDGQSITLVYVDSTKGWINVQNAEDTETGIVPAFVAASGGTVTTVCTNFKVHTFTSPGTFTVTNAGNASGSDKISYLVVAGGGAGGGANGGGGGGGAGGFRFANCTSMPSPQSSPLAAPVAITASAAAFPITVGGGGSGGTGNAPGGTPGFQGGDGSASVFSTITSTGGGGGGGSNPSGNSAGKPGGSGGGEGGMSATGGPGAGNTPPVSPPQGNPGGNTNPSFETNQGSGGGGASAAGSGNGPTPNVRAGPGGDGSFVVQTGFAACNGTPGPVSGARGFAGGGGGQAESAPPSCQGTGGAGGGSAGVVSGSSASNATTNTGGGGGGIDTKPGGQTSGNGGSGIVIIRYRFQ